MDPTSAKTGNVLYTMHETYVHPDGLQGHMALGAKYPDLFDKLMVRRVSHARAFTTCVGTHHPE